MNVVDSELIKSILFFSDGDNELQGLLELNFFNLEIYLVINQILDVRAHICFQQNVMLT